MAARVAVLVEPGTPGVVPQPTPVALLLETSDLGYLGPPSASFLEGVQLCQPAWSGANHGDPCCHVNPPEPMLFSSGPADCAGNGHALLAVSEHYMRAAKGVVSGSGASAVGSTVAS